MQSRLAVLSTVFILFFSLCHTVEAMPELHVTYEGVNLAGNHTWAARIAPDEDLFYDTSSGYGGSMAIELAFSVVGSEFVSITKDAVNYDFDNPGFNPFTVPEFTEGIWVSNDSTQAFASLGSRVFFPSDTSPHDALFFETLGSETTTLLYGTAASGDDELGTLIAQRGLVFSALAAPISLQALSPPPGNPAIAAVEIDTNLFFGYTGSVMSVPEPSSIAALLGLATMALAIRSRR